MVFNFELGGSVKLDRCGGLVWALSRETHHSLERAEDGGYWIPGRRYLSRESDSPFPPFETPIKEAFKVPEGADRKLVYRIMPLDEFRGPETVASTVAFLASEDASHINGVALRVDGASLS